MAALATERDLDYAAATLTLTELTELRIICPRTTRINELERMAQVSTRFPADPS